MQKMLHIFPYSGKSSDVQSCPTLFNPVVCQAPLSMGFSRQEYWSGLPYLHPKDLPGAEPMSLMSSALAVRFFTTSPTQELIKGDSFSLKLF